MNQPLAIPQTPTIENAGTLAKFHDHTTAIQRIQQFLSKQSLFLNAYLQKVQFQLNSQVQTVGKDLESAALVKPTNPIHHITGTGTISTINAPKGFTGPLMLISDDGFSFDTTGNITRGGEVPADTHLIFVYDGTNWVPQSNTTEAELGPVFYRVVNVSANYNVAADDVYIWGDATAGVFAVTLPPVASNAGRFLEISNIGSLNNVNVFGNGAELINGSNMQSVMPGNGMAVVTDGATWQIV